MPSNMKQIPKVSGCMVLPHNLLYSEPQPQDYSHTALGIMCHELLLCAAMRLFFTLDICNSVYKSLISAWVKRC